MLLRAFGSLARTPEAGGTYSEKRGLLVVDRGQADLRVDVQVAFLAARRPHGRLDAELVRLEVVVIVRTSEGQGAGDLLGDAGEVVGRLANALVALLEVGVSAVVNLEDGVLPWRLAAVSIATLSRLVWKQSILIIDRRSRDHLHP